MKKQNGFAGVLIILVLAILGVVGYVAYKDYSAKLRASIQTGVRLTTSQTPDPLAAVKEPYKSIFSDVSKIFTSNLDITANLVDYLTKGKMYWPVSNGALAIIDVNHPVGIETKSSCPLHSSDDLVSATQVDTSLAKLNTYLLTKNFRKISNPAFSTDSFSQSDSGTLIGYQNDSQGLMCIVMFTKPCFSESDMTSTYYRRGMFTCDSITDITSLTTPQLDYLIVFGVPGDTVDIVSQYGNFYYFAVSNLIRGGLEGVNTYIFAERSATGWTKIYDGQERIGCDVVEKYKVPHQLQGADKCYDTFSQQSINNPN